MQKGDANADFRYPGTPLPLGGFCHGVQESAGRDGGVFLDNAYDVLYNGTVLVILLKE